MNPEGPIFTHIDAGGEPAMVDVSAKAVTTRSATARSIVVPGEAVMRHFAGGDIETKKGPVFRTAIIAGTMAVKQTPSLIPFCHPVGLEHCRVHIFVNEANEIVVECTATVTAKTGVEMEALTGATVAALTVYDMCKALSPEIVIRDTRLIRKTGGKSDYTFSE